MAKNVIVAMTTKNARKSVAIRALSANRIEPSIQPLKDANVDRVRNDELCLAMGNEDILIVWEYFSHFSPTRNAMQSEPRPVLRPQL